MGPPGSLTTSEHAALHSRLRARNTKKKREKVNVSRADSFFWLFMPQTTKVRREKEQQQEAKEDGT